MPHSNDDAIGTICQKELSPQTHHSEHKETASPGKMKSFRIYLLNADKYNILSQALQAHLERRWGPLEPASRHSTRGEWVVLICETNNENNDLSAPNRESFLV